MYIYRFHLIRTSNEYEIESGSQLCRTARMDGSLFTVDFGLPIVRIVVLLCVQISPTIQTVDFLFALINQLRLFKGGADNVAETWRSP